MAEAVSNYELMVILAPQLMEQKKTPKDGVEEVLKRVGGEVKSADEWGEKGLSYPLTGHDKGYYMVYQIGLKPSALEKFKQRMKMEKGVLRWLILKKE